MKYEWERDLEYGGPIESAYGPQIPDVITAFLLHMQMY